MVWSRSGLERRRHGSPRRAIGLAGVEQVEVAALDRGLRLELAGAAADRGHDRRAVLDGRERPAGPLELARRGPRGSRPRTRAPAGRAPRRGSARPRRRRRRACRRWRRASARGGGPGRCARRRPRARRRSGCRGHGPTSGSARSRASRPTIGPVRRNTTASPAASATKARIGRSDESIVVWVGAVAQPGRARSAARSAGPTSNRSPTTNRSAKSAIGASGSRLTATIVPDVCIPTLCWIAPLIPSAR